MSKTTAGPGSTGPLRHSSWLVPRWFVRGSWGSWCVPVLDGRRPSKRSLTTGEPTGGAPGHRCHRTLDPGRCVAAWSHGVSHPTAGKHRVGRELSPEALVVPGLDSLVGHLAGSTPEPGADVRGAPGLTLDVPLGRR